MALTKVSRGLLSTSIVDNGNATAITIDSSENVGIGTTSPDTLLTVAHDTADQIKIGDTTDTNFWSLRAGTNFIVKDNDVEKVRIDSSGNVGIGTTSPSVPVHVYKSQASPTIVAKFENPADEAIVEIKSKNTDLGVLQFADTEDANVGAVQYSHSDNSMRFKTNDSERLRIDSSGQVGIGTSSPISELHIASDSPVLTLQDTTSPEPLGTYIDFKDSGGVTHGYVGYGSSASDVFQIVNSYDDIIMYTGSSGTPSERMRIDSNGNLLVGVTTTSVTSGGFSFLTGAVDYQMIGHASGVASGNYYIGFAYNGSTIGAIVQNGTTGIAYNTSSDQRLKENIADADDAGSKIDAIQVRQYDWKADGSHQDYGVIAQELVEVAPEAVTVPADSEEMMGVDYSKLVPMLIKEIQSLRNRVAQLEE